MRINNMGHVMVQSGGGLARRGAMLAALVGCALGFVPTFAQTAPSPQLTLRAEGSVGDRRVGAAVGVMLNKGRPVDTAARLVSFTSLTGIWDTSRLPFKVVVRAQAFRDEKDQAWHEADFGAYAESRPLHLGGPLTFAAGGELWSSPSGALNPPMPMYLLEVGAAYRVAGFQLREMTLIRLNGGGAVALLTATHALPSLHGWGSSVGVAAPAAKGFPGPGAGFRMVREWLRTERQVGHGTTVFAEVAHYDGLAKTTYSGMGFGGGVVWTWSKP